ncbi:type III polyketide synthase [Streptomyces sp. NPDC050732]|uniref:type III polyketide synthase n=1 Tax=Streptomyces sp. NPDC050732 TaxID=3154632 RepID=UPI0034137662
MGPHGLHGQRTDVMTTSTSARILNIGTAVPGVPIAQEKLWDEFFRDRYVSEPSAEHIFKSAGVRTRHCVWDPREHLVDRTPTLAERMRAWQEHVMALGAKSSAEALTGYDVKDVGSFTMASCTGYVGPTPEMMLAKEFGMPRTLRRTFVGHMGCFAAFNVLKVALDSVTSRPDELALANCSETCTVHLVPEATVEQIVVSSLFADASASVLLGPDDGQGPALLGTHTETHYETSDAMRWTVGDVAFRMALSPKVPAMISAVVVPFVDRLLEAQGLTRKDVGHWGIHPGGPRIVDSVGEALGIDEAGLAPSRRVLEAYGNCSSATILFVLKQIMSGGPGQRPVKPGDIGVIMAFGPGLTLESAAVRF